MSLYPLSFESEPEAHAYHAGDLLIAALWALNATDHGYGNRPRTLMGALSIQDKGTPYQLTRDALEGILRALTEDFDPQGLTLDFGMDCVSDVMGEANPTRRVIEVMRDRYTAWTAPQTD